MYNPHWSKLSILLMHPWKQSKSAIEQKDEDDGENAKAEGQPGSSCANTVQVHIMFHMSDVQSALKMKMMVRMQKLKASQDLVV